MKNKILNWKPHGSEAILLVVPTWKKQIFPDLAVPPPLHFVCYRYSTVLQIIRKVFMCFIHSENQLITCRVIRILTPSFQWRYYQCVTSYPANLPIILLHQLNIGIELVVWLALCNVFHSQYVQILLRVSLCTFPWYRGQQYNSCCLAAKALIITNCYVFCYLRKIVTFSVTISFHLHLRIITLSTLKHTSLKVT
jgi:hypothetical protein